MAARRAHSTCLSLLLVCKQTTAGQWIAPASRSKGKASGARASMAAPNDASGARSTSALMSRRWKLDRSKSPAATLGTHRCYLTCSTRFCDQHIDSVTADGAYDTRRCHNAIAERSAAAVIPPRKNAQPWNPTTTGAIARNDALRASKYLGRAIWRNWSGYHRRSRVETKMHCMKLLGQRLMSRDFDRQVAEVQVRTAAMYSYTAPGIPVTKAVG